MRKKSSRMRLAASPTKRTRPDLEVVDAAHGIEDGAVRIGIERVHGEVAALCVFGPVGGEGDGGAAAVGRHVAAQRRQLRTACRWRSP
ncbi:MAG: hypothetical protein WDN08_12860 [Rhizomicrobium sp.]